MQITSALTIKKLIENAEFEKALCLLNDGPQKLGLSPFDFVYLKAKLLLYEGDYLKASDLLKRLSANLNLDVLADLTLCYFQLGLMPDFLQGLETLTQEFKNQRNSLDAKEELNSAILIAKFYEEIGDPEKSLEILASIMPKTPYAQKAISIQKLRLLVSLEKTEDVTNLYREVLSGSEHNNNFEIEREHALLLADLLLLGVDGALHRYDYLCSLRLSNEDQAFLFCEIAEALILNKKVEIVKTLKLPSFTNSEYENFFLKIVRTNICAEATPLPLLSQFEKTLSPVSLVRILRVLLLIQPNHIPAVHLKLQLALSYLPSRKLQSTMKKYIHPMDTPLLVNFKKKSIGLNGMNHQIRSKFFWNLSSIFLNTDKIIDGLLKLETATQNLYNEIESPQHFDRTRMAIKRINNEVSALFGCQDLFKISKAGIECNMKLEVILD